MLNRGTEDRPLSLSLLILFRGANVPSAPSGYATVYVSPRWYHPPSSQCFDTDMAYSILLDISTCIMKFTVPK